MRTRHLAVAAAALIAVASTQAGSAYASQARASRAPTTVTIQANGTDLSGTVSSPKPVRCAAGRNVILMKQNGSRGGGDDQRIGSDTAEKQGNKYVWSTGNTGIVGHFYAKVKRTDQCQGDTSGTVFAHH